MLVFLALVCLSAAAFIHYRNRRGLPTVFGQWKTTSNNLQSITPPERRPSLGSSPSMDEIYCWIWELHNQADLIGQLKRETGEQ